MATIMRSTQLNRKKKSDRIHIMKMGNVVSVSRLTEKQRKWCYQNNITFTYNNARTKIYFVNGADALAFSLSCT